MMNLDILLLKVQSIAVQNVFKLLYVKVKGDVIKAIPFYFLVEYQNFVQLLIAFLNFFPINQDKIEKQWNSEIWSTLQSEIEREC